MSLGGVTHSGQNPLGDLRLQKGSHVSSKWLLALRVPVVLIGTHTAIARCYLLPFCKHKLPLG